MNERHRIRLGQTEWTLWADAMLRTPGFPAAGLDAFAAPGAAAAADAVLETDGDTATTGADATFEETFEETFEKALRAGDAELGRIIADPLFREALTWQNPGLLDVFGGGLSARGSTRRRQRTAVTRYWQRYCGKNETIGFFGPQLPVLLERSVTEVSAKPGAALVRDSRVRFEWWALKACADTLASRHEVRASFPPRLAPHLHRTGRSVARPAQPPLELTAAEAAAVDACDGRAAADVVAGLLADPACGVRSTADGYLLLRRLADAGVLNWDADLPLHHGAERILRSRIDAIDDERERSAARSAMDRLFAARDRVIANAGDPAALRGALSEVDNEFEALTGLAPRRHGGQSYAGRTLLYQDAARDIDVTVPPRVLDEIAEPLAVLLRAARWFTGALAREYAESLHELYSELSADGSPVRLADLWYLAQGLFWGSAERPVDRVAADFRTRWNALFGLDELPAHAAAPGYTAAELAARAEGLFDAAEPGWSAGRLHSPDLQICAAGVDAINRGEFTVVLGELHAAWATLDSSVMVGWHPDIERMRRMLTADLGERRIRPLYPPDWPRRTGRLGEALESPSDYQLAFADAPGAEPGRLLPATAVTVTESGGELVANTEAGERIPVIEMFSALLSAHAVDGFKLTAEGRHTPRISVGKLVVLRETWRFTVAELDVTAARTDAARFLAMRALRRRHELPERAFVKIGTETKPCYLDFTAPLHCLSVCLMLRSALIDGGPDVPVVFTELLPAPEHTWVPDAAGRHYFSELRLHAVDSAGAAS